jgi:hypothetical protein
MRTRCHKSYEKANPLAKGCNYLDILSRVSEYVFKKDLKKDVKMDPKEIKHRVNSPTDYLITEKEEEVSS